MQSNDNTLPGRIDMICQECGKTFSIKRSAYLTGRGQFCSRTCRSADQTIPLVDRFWAKVQKTDYCWIWTAAQNPKGYGMFCVDKKANDIQFAHRVSYQMHHRGIPEHLRVLHRCDNPCCVRPDHLFLGTPDDNMQDKVAKGRQLQGEQTPVAKMNDAQALEIRQRYAAGGISQAQLAREYGLNHSTVWSLIQEKTWRHLL